MKNVVDAVKYGIETLKISPEEMFSLFKVAHTEGGGISGDNYPLWLANEIMKIAEKENVGYSQLMVKKFAITQTILEGKEAVIKESYLEKFKKNIVVGNFYAVGYPEFGGTEVEIDWETGMDYDEDNAFFFETLPEGMRNDIKDNKRVSLMVRLSMESCAKNSELVQDAKARSVSVKTEGGAVLYRLCLMSDMFLSGSNFKVGFLVNTDFLSSELNSDVIRHFLRYFKYKGLVIPASELFEDYSVGGSFAFMVCSPRSVGDVAVDSIVLKDIYGGTLRYSRSKLKFREFLEYNSGAEGAENVEYFLSTRRLGIGSSGNIACLRGMLEYYVSYFAIVSSLEQFGFSGEIPVLVTGDSRYKSLLGNCLPLFIFDSENHLCLYESGKYEKLKEDLRRMYEKYKVYFSYEAKELVSVGETLLSKAGEAGLDLKGKSINDIRQELGNPDLNTAYLEALNNLKGYIKTTYREMS